MGTLFTDPLFKETLYRVSSKDTLLRSIDEFMDRTVILPPATWDKSIRLEPPTKVIWISFSFFRSFASSLNIFIDFIQTSGEGHGESPGPDSDEDTGLARTGVLFGGLWKDIRRKTPWYVTLFCSNQNTLERSNADLLFIRFLSDITDALSLQCLATWMFLYFACLTPMITFGGLMGLATHNSMGTM